MAALQGSAPTEEKVAAAETEAAATLIGIDALNAAARNDAAATTTELPKRPGAPLGVMQAAKRRVVAVAADPAPVLAPMLPVKPTIAVGDRSKEALDTPRTKLLPAPSTDWSWCPARINADAATTGPNGLREACGLKAGKFKVVMCTIHAEREITKHKSDFADPDNVPKFNNDVERLRCNTITPDLAEAGKRLLQEKFCAEEPAAAAYFGNVWRPKNITYAEANATLPNEPTDRVVGGVPTTSNAIERKNLTQKAVCRSRTARMHTCCTCVCMRSLTVGWAHLFTCASWLRRSEAGSARVARSFSELRSSSSRASR
jgi:hypothetical protein